MDITNLLKTGMLFGILLGLFYVISLVFNISPMVFLVISGLFVFFSYWFSDSLVLKMTRATIVDEHQAPALYSRVADLAQRAGIPRPRIAIVKNPTPNAFATGRSPGKAVIAVHSGLLNMMSPDELDGVLAHELSHVKHWDTLIQTIAALFATAIMFVSRMAFWFSFTDRDGNSNGIALLITWIVAPIAALLVQMAISRSREFAADHEAAKITGNPIGLANALRKLDSYSRYSPRSGQRGQPSPSLSHLYISNPLSSKSFAGMFSTHPPVIDRISRLEQMTY
ncbi:MAG: zinc metalloprotease HtpX [Candidatus Hodarchaeales archaeon]|jgi:heat shock protein HtpX